MYKNLLVLPCCEEYVVDNEEGEDVCDIIAKFGYKDCHMFSEIAAFNDVKRRFLSKGETLQVC